MFASSQKKKKKENDKEAAERFQRERESIKKKGDVRLTARYSAFIVVYHLHLAPLFI